MGILDFWRNYIGRLQGIHVERLSTCNTIWLDLNSILYEILEVSYKQDPNNVEEFLEKFEKNLRKKLTDILEIFKPQDILGIMVDGIAPMAKIVNQRIRRYRQNELKSGIKNFKDYTGKSFTPGTKFMIQIDKMIKKFIKNIEIEYTYTNRLEVIYSSHMEPGEGEQKIMRYFREGYGNIFKGREKKNIIVGNDNDLIILSLMTEVNGIYILKNIKNETMISIDNLKEVMDLPEEIENPYDDFCVLVSFLGNDFIPRSPAMDRESSFDLLLDSYRKKVKKGIVTKRIKSSKYGSKKINIEINWELIKEILLEFTGNDGLIEMNQIYSRDTVTDILRENSIINGEFNGDIYRALWYHRVFAPRTSIITLNEENYLSEKKLSDMVNNYLHGILWTLTYYNVGTEGINQEYYYKYDYAPLLWEIVNKNIENDKYVVGRESGTIDYTVLENLFSVLSKISTNLLPRVLRPLMKSTKIISPISDLYPVNWIVDTDGTPATKRTNGMFAIEKYERSVIILPELSRPRIRAALIEILMYRSGKSYKEIKSILMELTLPREIIYYQIENGITTKIEGEIKELSFSGDINLGDETFISNYRRDFTRSYIIKTKNYIVDIISSYMQDPIEIVPTIIKTTKLHVNKYREFNPRVKHYLESMYQTEMKSITSETKKGKEEEEEEDEDYIKRMRYPRRKKEDWSVLP